MQKRFQVMILDEEASVATLSQVEEVGIWLLVDDTIYRLRQ
jgi:hypothetical protein